MKIFLNKTVFESSLERIRWLFDEFPNVIVGISGGKYSTVVFNLSLMVAKEKGRLPLRVMFLDQEAEWQCVIDHIRSVMTMPEVKPMWYQMPIRIFNATSRDNPWAFCWEEGKEWIREKEEMSVKVNVYGTDRFHQLFPAILEKEFPETKTCYIAGVRAEESPKRYVSLTSRPKYKWATWGKILNKAREHYTFYPLYDWGFTDIWKAINDNNWTYSRIYDYQYQYGIRVTDMRVSNVHHETSVHALFYMQVVEPDNWNKIVARLHGINTVGMIGRKDFFIGRKQPFMFKDWREYRDYLLDNLIVDTHHRERFRKRFTQMEKELEGFPDMDKMFQEQVNTMVLNDFEMSKIANFWSRPKVYGFRKEKERARLRAQVLKDSNDIV